MIPCPTCGTENPERAKFCAECATPLVGASARTSRETRKLVTILFSDVAGSTALGEQLDPETLRALLGRYFAIMKRVIEAHGGMVEKFIGDAVMAVFGVPVVHEDDALRAVRAAAAIRTQLQALDTELGAGHGHVIRFRTGINTGEVVAGGPNAEGRLVTGDAVNTAARLEQAAQPGEILLGHTTWRLVHDAVTVEPIEPLTAKGKVEPVLAYRLVDVDPHLAGHLRRLDTPLVGRERELAALNNAFDRVASERSCQLFTLLGSAGVGKSRLVAEFTAAIAEQATVLRGRCLSYGEGLSYWPLREIVRTAAGIDESDPPDEAVAKIRILYEGQRDADLLAPRVAAVIGLSDQSPPQEEVFWAIRRLMEHVARKRPLVVVIEDIQWAAPAGLDLIEHIADLSRDTPVLLLCPARPDLLDMRPGWGGGKVNATTLLLEPLGTAATDRLIAAMPGGRALPPAVAARVAAAAEGNPLFIEELLGILVDDGFLRESADGSWDAGDDLEGVRIPPSIGALLAARLDSLGPDERAVAERASVVGRIFEQAAVTELATDDLRREVGRSLVALVRKELIRPERSDSAVGEAYKFRHILIRDAAYEAIPKAERARLHEHFADWLEDRSAGDPGDALIVGYHLEQAHRYRVELGEDGPAVRALADRALGRLGPAGRAALERGDPGAAASLLRRAVDLSEPGHDRIELLIDLRSALRTGGQSEASDAADREVVEWLAGHPDEALEHRRWLAESLFHIEGTVQEAERAYAYFERVGDPMSMISALEVEFNATVGRGFAPTLEVLDRATALTLEIGRPDRAARFSARSAWIFPDSPMPVPEVLERLRRYLDMAGDDRQSRAMVLLNLGELEARSGIPDSWHRHFDAAKDIIDDLGLVLPLGVAEYPIQLADTELVAGEPARVVELLIESCSTLDRLGEHSRLASMAPVTAQTLLVLGRLEEVERYAFWGRDIAKSWDIDAHVRSMNALSGLRSLQGRHDEAIDLATESVSRTAGTDFLVLRAASNMALARAHRAAGDEPRALVAAQEAERLATAKGDEAHLRSITTFLRG